MFAMADGSQLAYIKESEWGTTPATPAWQILRLTGESFKIARETKQSAEITPERNVSDLIHIGGGASGGFNFEMSYGAYDDIFASMLYGAWDDNVLVNGVTQSSLSFEKKFLVDTATYNYFRYTGMVPNTMNLSIAAGEIITGSFDFMGKGGSVAATAIASSTYVDAAAENVLSASSHVGALSLGSFATAKILNLNLSATNNLMSARVIGSLDNADIGAGQFNVSGSVEIYFEDKAVYEAYLNATEMALSVTMGSITAKKYTIELPRIKFSDGEVVASGQNSYVMANMSFQALGDPTEECTMKITRAVV